MAGFITTEACDAKDIIYMKLSTNGENFYLCV